MHWYTLSWKSTTCYLWFNTPGKLSLCWAWQQKGERCIHNNLKKSKLAFTWYLLIPGSFYLAKTWQYTAIRQDAFSVNYQKSTDSAVDARGGDFKHSLTAARRVLATQWLVCLTDDKSSKTSDSCAQAQSTKAHFALINHWQSAAKHHAGFAASTGSQKGGKHISATWSGGFQQEWLVFQTLSECFAPAWTDSDRDTVRLSWPQAPSSGVCGKCHSTALVDSLGPVVKRLVCWQLTCPWCHCHLSAMYPPGASVSCHCKSARSCAHSIKAESEILITPRQVPRQTTQCLTGQLSGRWCRRLPLDDLIRSNRARLINHWRQGWQA